MAIALREHTDIASGALDARTTKLANNAKIAYALFTGIVKDKIGYTIREYAKNAWEVSPADRPFVVELPGRWFPKLRIRDYGPGLSHHFMMHRYPRLGDSTKDGEGIGGVSGWGFGSKAALAYLMEDGLSGSYTVVSYRGGTASHYIISLSEGGMPTVKHFMDVPTEEPDGLEVSFAVREDDFADFEQSAREILWSFEPRPTILPDLKFEEAEILAKGQGWTSFAKASVPFDGPQVRVGPVMYPIDMGEIPGAIGFLQPNDCIIFDVNPEDVSPTASREQLQYTSGTKKALSAMVAAYEQNFVAELQTKVDGASCYFDGCATFREATAHLGVNRVSHIRSKVQWGGQPIRVGIPEKTMHLSPGWTSFPRFESRDVDPANMRSAKVVVEHTPYLSLDRFLALDLVGQDILWVRVKKGELPGFLEMCALKEDDVTILDKAPIARKAPMSVGTRFNQIRRRRAVNVTIDESRHAYRSVWVSDSTESFDLSAGGLKVRRVRHHYSRRADGFSLGEGFSRLSENEFNNLLGRLHTLGILRENLRLLVDTDQDELDDSVWFDFGDYVEMRLRDLLDETQITPIQRHKRLGDIPSAIDKFVDQYKLEKAPDDINAFAQKVKSTRASLRLRDDRPTNPHDEVFRTLQIIRSGLQFPIAPATDCPVDALSRDYEVLMKKYPLFRHLVSDAYDKVAVQNRLNHYFDLLANQK
ncbi:hypothetical protein [uncultured Methylobacterium sp.]|jgi:hypothetical protein|uniref:hypothetical protein n=1 Tax=uncultured Methylobacterium sp. TaxID=157278 RepID=UPI0026255AE6|nr:hypothetical protein [uncultured Methylobacterium sp.]